MKTVCEICGDDIREKDTHNESHIRFCQMMGKCETCMKLESTGIKFDYDSVFKELCELY